MKILLWRTAAFGDTLITTPLIRHLHNQGHQVFYVASERGEEVLKNNPHVFKMLKNDETVKNELLGEHMQWLMRKNHCERLIDLNESIECAISVHPRSPDYNLPKKERLAKYNRNFYEYTFEHAKEPWDGVDLNPELHFTPSELSLAREHIKPMSYNVLVGLSGSGNNKVYPWMMDLCNLIQEKHPEVHLITVGDIKCQILEDSIDDKNITKLSGNIPMRQSMALTGLVDLVISPDTGLLHASGCYDTPKIGLLGHTTKEHITKHFMSDYSIEADEKLAPCSPCTRMIYSMSSQCPLNPETRSSICLADGIPMERVYRRFKEVYEKT